MLLNRYLFTLKLKIVQFIHKIEFSFIFKTHPMFSRLIFSQRICPVQMINSLQRFIKRFASELLLAKMRFALQVEPYARFSTICDI